MLRSSEEVKDIQALILILDEMRKRGLSRDQVADHIEQKAPRFTALKIFLPSNAGELYGFLGFLTGAAVFFTLITVLSKVQRRTLDLFEK